MVSSKTIAALAVVVILIASAVGYVFISGDNDAPDDDGLLRDAAGNELKPAYNYDKIVTVGVGALRWVSYFGLSDHVVSVDMGDVNPASWSGKGYRSLLSDEANKAAEGANSASKDPLHSDYVNYGISAHDYNNFSTSNLEVMKQWPAEDKPTLFVIAHTVYQGLTKELITGITASFGLAADIVVINEVDSFVNSDLTLSKGFKDNLQILAHTFNAPARAEQLERGIFSLFADLDSLIDGKTPKYASAYIGGVALSGAKELSSTVGDYLPFKLAKITNSYPGTNTTAIDLGSEAMSKVDDPDIIFIDYTSLGPQMDKKGSISVCNYADKYDIHAYVLLPYYWFGYNFDNAIANAYLLIYYCYDDALTYEETMQRIAASYELFLPEISNKSSIIAEETYNGGEVIIPNMVHNYYSKQKYSLELGAEYDIDVNNDVITFKKV